MLQTWTSASKTPRETINRQLKFLKIHTGQLVKCQEKDQENTFSTINQGKDHRSWFVSTCSSRRRHSKTSQWLTVWNRSQPSLPRRYRSHPTPLRQSSRWSKSWGHCELAETKAEIASSRTLLIDQGSPCSQWVATCIYLVHLHRVQFTISLIFQIRVCLTLCMT